MTRRSGPQAAPRTPAKKSNRKRSTCYKPGPPDAEYDDLTEALGYSSDPITADEWAAICMAEARDLAEVVE